MSLAGGPLETNADVERAVRSFAESHRALLGCEDPAELRLTSLTSALGKWGVIFEQMHEGIPVIGSRLRFLLTRDGRLTYVSSEWHPRIRMDLVPSIGAQAAVRLAGRAIGYREGRDRTDPSELVILTR